MMHTATYQDNNISSAVALSSLQYLLENDVPGQVQEKSKYIWDGLRTLQTKYPKELVEIRGRGFMIGLKLGANANDVGRVLAQKHFIQVMTSINDDTILRVYPNITTTNEDYDWFLDALEKSIQEVFAL
jgi:putrescine aminotransferase